jgi:putative CocE/NonD family hydrolase
MTNVSLSGQRGPYGVVRESDIPMRTRDGKTLYADLYRPVGVAEAATLVRRTPYGKHLNDLAEEFNEAHYYASHGYLTVVQNTRGRFGSEGAWYPLAYEALDGYDTIEWAAQLDGSNGRVGTFGQSYGALSQYLAAAQRPPHLVTAVPVSAYLASYENFWYNHGAIELAWTLSYLINMAIDALSSVGDHERLSALQALKTDPSQRFSPLTDEALRHLPLQDWVERLGQGAPFLADILHHSSDGLYWWAIDLRRQLHNIEVPILHVGSWYDIANPDTPTYFTELSDVALGERARKNQALFMGPWGHLLPYNQPTTGGAGDIDFGPEAAYPLLELQRAWFDHFLRDGRPDLPGARVKLFVTGLNAWRDETAWPPTNTTAHEFYLHADRPANTSSGSGELTEEPASTGQEPDSYVYDPDDPVPTAGGRFVGGGVADQRSKQSRSDVLVYSAPARTTPLEAIGPVILRLFVATDAPDTDFIAVLSDVYPDGFVQNLAEGLVRMRYRDSYDEPSLLGSGIIHEITVDLGNIAHAFLPGHSVRLHVTSSDFPRWDRNLNTGEPLATSTRAEKATQTVYHDAAHPSALVLRVVTSTT